MTTAVSEHSAARLSLACKIYQSRLERTRFFDFPIFSDAGWDTLLAIYVFEASGRLLTATELVRATVDTPKTSSLRMQRRLVDLGYIRRVEDEDDKRRLLLQLTPSGRERLERYLDYVLANNLAPQVDSSTGEPALLTEIRTQGTAPIERMLSGGRAKAALESI